MLRSCPRCGRIHGTRGVCPAGRRDPVRRTEEMRLRNLNVWHKKSEEIREKAYHLCEVCMDQQKDDINYSFNRLEVHHIVPLKKTGAGGLLDDLNLVALCPEHHKLADAGEISQDYLFKLAEQREGRG